MYKIYVHINNNTSLIFRNVKNYQTLDGGFIKFIDTKFNTVKIFDSRICEIEEVNEND